MKYHKKKAKLAGRKHFWKTSSVIQAAISRNPGCFTEPGSFKGK